MLSFPKNLGTKSLVRALLQGTYPTLFLQDPGLPGPNESSTVEAFYIEAGPRSWAAALVVCMEGKWQVQGSTCLQSMPIIQGASAAIYCICFWVTTQRKCGFFCVMDSTSSTTQRHIITRTLAYSILRCLDSDHLNWTCSTLEIE